MFANCDVRLIRLEINAKVLFNFRGRMSGEGGRGGG